MSKIDLVQLAQEIQVMAKHQPLYRTLRDGLSEQGRWRQRPRGNPQKAYKAMLESMSKKH